MLIISNNKLVENMTNQDKDIFIECLCLHARNIIEFLFFNKSKKYNRAVYYLSKNQWEIFLKNKKTKNELLMDKINSKVSHLNFNRDKLNSKKYSWENTEIFTPLLQDIKQFLFLLPKEFYTENLLNLKTLV